MVTPNKFYKGLAQRNFCLIILQRDLPIEFLMDLWIFTGQIFSYKGFAYGFLQRDLPNRISDGFVNFYWPDF